MSDIRDTVRDGVRDTVRDTGKAVNDTLPANRNSSMGLVTVIGVAAVALVALFAFGAFNNTTTVPVATPSNTSSSPTTL